MDADRPGAQERRLAGGTLRMLALLAVSFAGVASVVAGPAAAASAVIGVGFVAVLFGCSAALLALVAARGSSCALAVLVGGVVGRLVLYAAALSGLGQLGWVHRPSLALATAAAVALTLAYELRTLARMPRLFWIDAHAGHTAALDTTRSR